MMNDKQLREALRNGAIKLEGADLEKQLGNVTIDITLGKHFLSPRPDQIVDVTDPNAEVLYDEQVGDYTLMPGEFVLAVMREIIELDNQHMATIYGRSNTSRVGLVISEGPIIDSGFRGTITLELYNQSPHPIILREGYRIGHLAFHKLDEPVDVGYMDKPNAKYTDQTEVKPYPWRLDKEWRNKEE